MESNLLVLSKNYKNYRSGNYHQDIVDSLNKHANCYFYGPGYQGYNENDTIEIVLSKAKQLVGNVKKIITTTSWDVDHSTDCVNPHKKIKLNNVEGIKKIYFLNKEYKKLDLRFNYIIENKFDHVVTVHPDYKKWQEQLKVNFIHLPFGISLERFKDKGLPKKYDFGFSGALHKSHTDLRYKVKQELFKNSRLEQKSNKGLSAIFKSMPFKDKYKEMKIFWAEWGAKDFKFRSILPKGERYSSLLNQCKIFLNTPSAIGIFNTRFFELMATKTLIFCPNNNDYMGILEHKKNCIMYNEDMTDFENLLKYYINNDDQRKVITDNAYNEVHNHSYDERIKKLMESI